MQHQALLGSQNDTAYLWGVRTCCEIERACRLSHSSSWNWRPASVERLSLPQRMFHAPLLQLVHGSVKRTRLIAEPHLLLGHSFTHFLACYTRKAEMPSCIEASMFLSAQRQASFIARLISFLCLFFFPAWKNVSR